MTEQRQVEAGEGWRSMKDAPKDGTPIKLRVIYEFEASWQPGLTNSDDEDCCGWHATKGDIPPCWTDDICWEVNEDGSCSAMPSDWRALTPPKAT